MEHIVIEGPTMSGKSTIAWGITYWLGESKPAKKVARIEFPKQYRPENLRDFDIIIWDGCEPPPGTKITRRIKVELSDA